MVPSGPATLGASAIAQDTDTTSSSRSRKPYILLVVAILLMLGGGIIANVTQTDGGQISVRKVNFTGSNGTMMFGLLYVPKTATAKTPACGVVAIHGYINSHDTMDGFAIEMARRGCVVLAPDQTGHGSSDAPAFANGYGGPDALAYLSGLDIVAKGDIGLVGHSMGGWASVIAAATHPAAYRSLVLVSSSTSTPGLEPIPGTPKFPTNVLVDEATYSEFAPLMWLEPKGALFPNSPRMQQLFGTTSAIKVGQLYGSISDGTARELQLVPTTHPGMTFNNEAIGNVIAWEQQTLTGVSSLPPSNQIWIWDELGTLLALLGFLLMIFPLGALLLRTNVFSELAQKMPEARPLKGIGWWVGALLTIVIGVFSFFQFQLWGNKLLPASSLFPETITTGIMAWAVGGGAIALVLFLVFHFGTNRRQGARLLHYGVTGERNTVEWRHVGKAILFAVAVLIGPYLALSLLDGLFNTDARIWVFNAKPITPVHVRVMLGYVVPFAAYFLMLGIVLHGELRSTKLSMGREILKNIVIMAIGFVVFLVVEYVPLLHGGTLFTADQPLLAIVAFQFVPVYIVIASISTYFFHKTGRIYTGALINTLLITALIVTSTAIQFPL